MLQHIEFHSFDVPGLVTEFCEVSMQSMEISQAELDFHCSRLCSLSSHSLVARSIVSQRTLHSEQLVARPFDDCASHLSPVNPDSGPLPATRGEDLTDNFTCQPQTAARVRAPAFSQCAHSD